MIKDMLTAVLLSGLFIVVISHLRRKWENARAEWLKQLEEEEGN